MAKKVDFRYTEQGRGYPSLDSLKEISKFFSVSIDDLICSEEIISAAADEKKECMDKYISLICNTLDIFLVLLLFLLVFGNGTDSPVSVSLYAITGISTWIKIVFSALYYADKGCEVLTLGECMGEKEA